MPTMSGFRCGPTTRFIGSRVTATIAIRRAKFRRSMMTARGCRAVSIASRVEEAPNGDLIVRSNFILVELRRSKQDVFAGRTIHRLRPEGDGLRISHKKVLLVNNDEVIDNLTFLV
jgi:3-phenylpropionate/cinnamic acid dioxygenase small subunit